MLQLFQKASATTRRFAAVALSFCMLLGIMANPLSGVMGVLAQNTPTVTVGNYTAKPGDTVAVTLDVSNNPGINAVKVQLGFNADVMTMQSYVADGVFPADKVSWGQEGNNPFVVNFADGLTQTNYTVNGKLATLTFKVADNATPGTYPLTLTFDEAYNVDWDEPVFTMVNGSLTVEAAGGAPSCTHTYDNACDADCNLCGETRTPADHVYDDATDATCNVCGDTRTLLPTGPYVAITENFSVNAGDTIAVPIVVGNNPGINAVKVQIGFNADVMTMQSYVADGVFPAEMVSWGQEGNNPFVVNFADALTQTNYTVNGKLATITFKVADNAVTGDYPLTLTFDEAYNVDWDEPVFAVVGATVHVNGAACAHAYDDCDDTDCNTCGATREAQAHAYDNDADTTCNNCAHTRNLLPVDPYVAITDNFIVNAGDTIAVPIVVGNNPGINAVKVQLGFNAAVMTMQSYVADGVFPAEMVSWGQEGNNPFVVNFADALTQTNYTVNGKLATLTFKVADDAITGDYPLTLTFDEAYNVDWDEPVFAVVSATVHVEGTACTHNYDNACDADCNTCGATRTPADHVYDNVCDADCNVCGATRTVEGHAYDNACDADCNKCGTTRTPADHVYDNACDADCNVCGTTRTPADHVYDNACDADCNVCGATRTPADHVYDDCDDTDCNVCGKTRRAVNHTYDNNRDPDCNKCGKVRDVSTKLPTAHFATSTDTGSSLTYGVTYDTLEEGKTYIISLLWKSDAGNLWLAAHGNALGSHTDAANKLMLINADKTAGEGVSYDATTGRMIYTFTATGTTVKIYTDLMSGQPAAHNAYLADLKISDDLGNKLFQTAFKKTGGVITGLIGYEADWGDNWQQYITFEEKTYDFFGSTDRADCAHAYDNDCDTICDACGTVRTVSGHEYTDVCDETCNICGVVRVAPHEYDNDKDESCNVCGEIRVIPAKIPTVYMNYYASASSQSYSFSVEDLTVGETYTLSMLYKRELRTPTIYFDDTTRLISGVTPENGAVYNEATGVLTYDFVAAKKNATVKFTLEGDDYAAAYVADVKVLAMDGTVVYKAEGVYEEGTLTGLTGGKGGSEELKYISFGEREYDFFGATDPQLCTHTYSNDCDNVCNVCATSRASGHAYDDVCDETCNNCGNSRTAPHNYADSKDTTCDSCGNVRVIPLKLATVQVSYWASAANQVYGVTVGGLTKGETYVMTMLYKKDQGTPAIVFDGKTRLILGDVAENGATYDAATGLLTFAFVANDADATFCMDLPVGSQTSGYWANLIVKKATGETVYVSEGEYDEDGNLIEMKDGYDFFGNNNYIFFSEKTYDFFGATEPDENACDHRYDNACDADCNKCNEVRVVPHSFATACATTCSGCGATREANPHLYDDEYDNTCSICGEARTIDGYDPTIIPAVKISCYGGTDQGYGVTMSDLVVGETYTVSFLWRHVSGTYSVIAYGDALGVLWGNQKTLMDGATAGDNVRYNEELGRYEYTFIAAGSTLSVMAYLGTGTAATGEAWFADVRVKSASGTTVFTTEGVYEDGVLVGFVNGGDRWGSRMHCYFEDKPYGFFKLAKQPGADVPTEACAHAFDNACDTACNLCGAIRLTPPHVFDNKNDPDCNECGAPRPTAMPTVKINCYGPVTQGYTMTVEGLEVGKEYTLSFRWKSVSGTYSAVAYGTAIGATSWSARKELMLGKTAAADVDFDAVTGKVTYTFTAKGTTLSFGAALESTVGGGYSDAYLADAMVVDGEGNIVYELAPLYEGNVLSGFDEWSDRWGTNAYLTFSEKEPEFFDTAPDTFKDLTIDGFTLSPAFKSWVTDYELTIPGETTVLNIVPELYDDTVTFDIYGNGNYVPDSDHVVTIVAKGADGSNVTYTINIRVYPVTKDALSSLTVKGYDIDFDPHVYDYELTVPHTQGALEFDWTLGADAKPDSTPVVTGNIDFEEETTTKVTITVENADGTFTPYYINVTKLVNPADVITAVNFKGGHQVSHADYKGKVIAGKTYMFDFLYKEIAGEKIFINFGGDVMLGATKALVENGKGGEGVAVVPETGRHSYMFKAEAEAFAIQVIVRNYSDADYTVPTWEGWVGDFRMYEVDPETGKAIEGGHVVEIDNTFVLDDPSTEEKEGNWTRPTYGGYTYWNIVENVHRSFFKMDYTLSLDDLKIDGVSVPGFHTAIKKYFTDVSYKVDSVLIEPTLGVDAKILTMRAGGKVITDNRVALEEGANEILLEIQNHDDTIVFYSLTINKQVEPAAILTDLKLSAGTLDPTFDSNVYKYAVTVPFEVTDIDVDLTGSENAILVGITGNEDLPVGLPTDILITLKNGKGRETVYVVTVTREGKSGETERLQGLVLDAASKITVTDFTTQAELQAMLAEALNDSTYTLAVVDFYRLRSVTEVKDNYETLVEGKDGYLAAVVNITDGESLAQVTVTKTIKPETVEYTFTEDDLPTEDEFIFADDECTIVDFYLGDATKLIIPEGVTELAYGWLDPWDVEAIKVVVLPSTLKVMPTDMLYGALSVETVVIRDGVTKIGTGAFSNLPMVRYIRLPETLKSIGTNAFKNNVSLASIRIPESVEEIENNAFYYTMMREVTIPAGVSYIGDKAFADPFAAAQLIVQGSNNISGFYPFQSADDPRVAQLQAWSDKHVDWFGAKPTSPAWDTLESAMAEGFGKDELYGTMTSTRRIVTILNKDCEFGSSPFYNVGIWGTAPVDFSIAEGAKYEADLETYMQIANNSLHNTYEDLDANAWGTRDMSLAEVTARSMFALDKLVIGAKTTVEDILSFLAKDFFSGKVTAEIPDLVLNAETQKATGTLVLTQGNIVAKLTFEKDVDLEHVAPGEESDLFDVTDDSVITIDLKNGKLVVKAEASLVDIVAALKLAEGVEVDMYDELGNYIPPEFYSYATNVDGFVLKLYKDGALTETWTFSVPSSGDAPEGELPEEEQPDDEQPEGDKPESEQPEGEQPEGEKPEEELPEVESDLFEVIDTDVILGALDGNKVVVKDGTTLADIIAALKLAVGVEVEVYDALGNYVDPETYGDIVDIDGFVMKLYKDGALTETWTISVLVEDEQPEDDPSVPGEDVENPDDGVTSIATAMILLMAGAAVVLLALRRRKVTE